MQKDLNDLARNENIGGGGGQQSSQENLAKNCYSSKFVPDSTGLFHNCLVQILNKFGIATFSRLFLRHSFTQTASSSSTAYATPIFALPMVALRYLFGAISLIFCNFRKRKSQQIKQLRDFVFSSLNKVACSLSFVKDLLTISPALPGRRRTNQQRNGGLIFQHPNSGIIMMLLILFMPIAFFGIKYSQTLLERRQKVLEKTDGPFYRKYYPTKVAVAVAKEWDHLKTLGNQDQIAIYAAAFDSGVWCQNSTLGGAIDGIILSSNNTSDENASLPAINGPANAPTTSADKATYAKKDITITVEDDKIKVTCDKKYAYALPAACNLDLVLAIPTNANAEVGEIAKTFANFLRDNFYHTRGVYTSVIPYSGKLSLPSSRYDGWTEAFPNFNNPSPVTLYSLYGTSSVSGNTSIAYNSAGANNGYSIMCRASLFDTTNASTSKYKRMNTKPCTSFGLSADSGITSPTYTTYVANPHPIMEPVADLSTAYAKCNGLTQPSDTKNTSSFSFAALEWANNMFQNWTSDPKISAIAGENNGILSSPSKITSGRKKAIILTVNKPDMFTDGEMTYLGLSNDIDEKRVDLDWKETSNSEGRQVCYGNNKFLAVQRTYIYCSNDGITWTKATLPFGIRDSSICYGNGNFFVVGYYEDLAVEQRFGRAAYSSNGTDWTTTGIQGNQWQSVCYGNSKFIAVGFYQGFSSPYTFSKIAYSSDGSSWTEITPPSGQRLYSVCYGNSKFITVGGGGLIGYSSDGANWTETTLPSGLWLNSVCYGNSKFVTVGGGGLIGYSSDGVNWTETTLPSGQSLNSICYGNGKFVTVGKGGLIGYSSDGANWTETTLPSGPDLNSVCCGDNKFVVVGSSYAACGEFVTKTSTIGNKALKDALIDGSSSGVTTLTTNACTKLKETYGSNIRIDIVKYKASGTDDDYQYLKDCAEETGGKLHRAEDETSLKSTLDTIAADLKSWAGYQEARVVK